MQWLQQQVEHAVADPTSGGAVERLVFGTSSPAAIAEALDAACRAEFGASLQDGFLYRVSVGCVFGCRLADGRDVVVKAYQPRWTPEFLAGVQRVQRHLWAGGFPCPQPLGEIFVVGRAPAVAEAVLVDPKLRGAEPGMLAVSSAGLAEQIERCRAIDEPRLAEHPLRRPHRGVFPQPHSPIFDFDATTEGAAWIDDIAQRARAARDEMATPAVIAHTDWSLRNIRIVDGELVAVYDGDSLAVVPEHVAVGQAAATWRNDGATAFPDMNELDRYLDAYASARGRSLSNDERRGALAAAVWNLAYLARCEHALDPDERRSAGARHSLRRIGQWGNSATGAVVEFPR